MLNATIHYNYDCNINGHSADPATIKATTPPTCISDGVETAICSKCSQTIETVIPVNPSAHTFVDGICTYCHVVRPAGDISGDAKVNAVDSNLMKQIIPDGAKTPGESKFADLNGDGKVNAVDMNLLKQIILGE